MIWATRAVVVRATRLEFADWLAQKHRIVEVIRSEGPGKGQRVGWARTLTGKARK